LLGDPLSRYDGQRYPLERPKGLAPRAPWQQPRPIGVLFGGYQGDAGIGAQRAVLKGIVQDRYARTIRASSFDTR
jgi:hypothetical protein